MRNKKYIIDYNGLAIRDGHELHRIKRLNGELGGWIEHESNLSQEGDCWIYSNAKVYGNSRVTGDSVICHDSVIIDSDISGKSRVEGASKITDCIVHNSDIEDAIVYDDAITGKKIKGTRVDNTVTEIMRLTEEEKRELITKLMETGFLD